DAYLATEPSVELFGSRPAEAWLRRAAILEELGRRDEADKAFEAAFAAEPESRVALRSRRGDHLAYHRRDFTGALADFVACRADDPAHARWYGVRIAVMQAARGDRVLARATYADAVDGDWRIVEFA